MVEGVNRQIVLAARPVGYPQEEDFQIRDAPMPTLGERQVLVRNLWLSLDPYQRGRMSDAPSYTASTEIGDVMTGGTVGRIVASNSGDFAPGEIVQGQLGWQDYAISNGSNLRKLDPSQAPISTALGVLGMPGLTAYFGLFEVKRGILAGFRMGKTVDMSGDRLSFFDKSTYPLRDFDLSSSVRIVPGGSSVRDGCYVGTSVTCMPPMYINVGAYVGDGSMIDSHALVGSCAQVGKSCHISAAAQIGGVLEPVGALPVIIEDNVLVGGNCGVYEGTIVRSGAVLGAGVIVGD